MCTPSVIIGARRAVSLGLLVSYGVTATACQSWQTEKTSPQQILDTRHPKTIRVTRMDGTRLFLDEPTLRADTLVGRPRKAADTARTAIPFADIKELAVHRLDAGRTIALTAGIGLVALIGALSDCCGPDFKSNDSLKSSPLVYSWDGHDWRLDSGTFAGAITEGAARTDVDNLDFARPEGSTLRLRVTNELQETDYLDALGVLAVDHDPSVDVAPDGQNNLHTVGALVPPAVAADLAGRAALPAVLRRDGVVWESVITGRDSAAAADVTDGLELAFPRNGATRARLVLDAQNTPWVPAMLTAFVMLHGTRTQAWYDTLDTRPAQLAAFGAMLQRAGYLQASVRADGRWVPQGAFGAPGPELAKRQVLALDLSGVRDDTVRVRLTSAPAFWAIDQVALDTSAERPVRVRALVPVSAVTADGQDILPLIRSADRRYLTIESGESADLRFDLPAPPPGTARTFLARSTGWYRIRAPAAGEADVSLLDRLLSEPAAAAQFTVGRLNRVLAWALAVSRTTAGRSSASRASAPPRPAR